MKQRYGLAAYVQSAGVKSDADIDGFAITVCAEVGIELSRHRVRSFEEMEAWGGQGKNQGNCKRDRGPTSIFSH